MTIVLNSNMKLNDLDGLTIKIAQWVQSTIKELYDYDLQIKKPNDLYLNQKKIGGILTQTSIIGEKINYLLISVGFNVNETQFSEEVKNIATSLKKEYNKDFSKEEIIIKLIEKVEKEIES